MSDEVLDTWIIETIRITMGIDFIRNAILKYFLKSKTIEYGPTFSIDGKEDLNRYLKHIIKQMKENKNKTILFTCNNDFGISSKVETNDTPETHYQTFIIDTKIRRIIMIDPSRRHRESGIYSPYAAWYIGSYLTEHIDCDINWLNLKNPCQVYENDVFCQSWSLFLQLKAMKANVIDNPDIVIDIPYSLHDKYTILLDFYKTIIKKIPIVKKQLLYEWKDIIDTKIDYNDKEYYHSVNIASEFNLFKVDDIYTASKEDLKEIASDREYFNEKNNIYTNTEIFSTEQEIIDANEIDKSSSKLRKESRVFLDKSPKKSPSPKLKRRSYKKVITPNMLNIQREYIQLNKLKKG